MSRKPPPEGARWTIPDWSPDASAHEQEVMQYLDQLEVLRRELAQEKETAKAQANEIEALKEKLSSIKTSESLEIALEDEKRKSRDWASQSFRLVDKVHLLEKEKADLELKIPKPKPPTKRDFVDNIILYGVLTTVGISLLHSLYALGSWGWAAITAPSQSQEDARIEKAALQCALQQRAIIQGRPESPLEAADKLVAAPKALQPAPKNFLSVGETALPERWARVALKNLSFTGSSGFFSKLFSVEVKGTLTNYTQSEIDNLQGQFYVIGLRGPSLVCEPIASESIYISTDVSPGSSKNIEYNDKTEITDPKDDDLVIRFFFELVPMFEQPAAAM